MYNVIRNNQHFFPVYIGLFSLLRNVIALCTVVKNLRNKYTCNVFVFLLKSMGWLYPSEETQCFCTINFGSYFRSCTLFHPQFYLPMERTLEQSVHMEEFYLV